MIDRNTLTRWCTPIHVGGPYLRPLVIRGPHAQGGAFIVGVNPATPIFESDGVSFCEYADSLLSTEAFLSMYCRIRIAQGKPATSRTRAGLDGAAQWLQSLGFNTVLDTNISPYPTRSEAEWKRLSNEEKELHVFPEIVQMFRPSVVLLHGRVAYRKFTSLYAPGLKKNCLFTEIDNPYLGTVDWDGGGKAEVFVCGHLKSFGRGDGGEKFAPLRTSLTGLGKTAS